MIAEARALAGDYGMFPELVWKNPSPPTRTEVRIVRDKANGGVTGERRYLAYWGLSIFFPLRCVVFDVIAGRTRAA